MNRVGNTGKAPRILGLMSGTSADGVDVVLLELNGFPALGEGGPTPPPLLGAVPRGRVLEHVHVPYPPALRELVLGAASFNANQKPFATPDLAQLHFELGAFFASAARGLARSADLIASHGQTVYHIPRPNPSAGWRTRATLQLGEPALIAEATGKPVVADFRPSDMAAGGQGAPLVPFADVVLFSEAGVKRAIHNLGGISNLTYMPGNDKDAVLAFDTGPANCLIDEAASKMGRDFDAGGVLAARGQADLRLLEAWMRDPYFELPAPKSTGREYWNLDHLAGVFELDPLDAVASVTTFSSASVALAYRRFVLALGLDEIVVAGGGSQNPMFMQDFAKRLAPVPVRFFEDKGWHRLGFTAQTREAAAFAVLGYFAAQGWANTLPKTTGARRAVVAGKLLRP